MFVDVLTSKFGFELVDCGDIRILHVLGDLV